MLEHPFKHPFISPLRSAFYTSIYSALPPDFPPDSFLLTLWDGTNTDATHKTDVINGYDLTAVEGPCLTLVVGDKIYLPGHGASVTNLGTAVLAYDDYFVTLTGDGTVFGLEFTDGIIVPCCEGSGDTVGDTSGLYIGDIIYASDPWTTTQDDYFYPMDEEYYSNSDGIFYPYDPDVFPITPPVPPEQLGAELVVNHDFATGDTTGWSFNTIVETVVDNALEVSVTTSSYRNVELSYIAGSLPSGTPTKIVIDVSAISGGDVSIDFGDTVIWITEPGVTEVYNTEANPQVYARLWGRADGMTFTLESLSVKEVL